MRESLRDFPPHGWAYGGGRLVATESREFRRFSRRMDRRLAKLVDQWIHAAAPNAVRPQRKPFAPKPPSKLKPK